jgi:HAMP domain-containing protein
VLFGKFRILGKLALLVLIPLLGVVALSVPIVLDRISAAQDAQSEANEVAQAIRVSTALQALQTERILSVGFTLGLVQESALTLQTAKAIDAVNRIDDGSGLSDAMRRALRGAAKLDNTRQNVLNRAINPDAIVTEFTTAVTPLITGVGLAASADLRTSVGRQLFALERALRTDDQISQAASYLTAAVVARNQGLIGLFSSTLVQIQNTTTDAQLYFTDAQYRLYLAAQDAFSARVGSDFLTQAAIDPVAAVGQLKISTLFPSLQSVLVLSGFVEKRVASDVNTLVTGNRDTAIRDAVLIGGGSILLLLLVVLLSLFMARAVARPLRRLTASADRVAREAEAELERVADDEEDSARPIRLDPVDVEGQDEIGDLARAFDRVQTTAVRLVERQVLGRRNVAQMFAHVGRRTQNLVGRQLALIDNLERRETDSERLGELYRLDHMSSRLRRNASSLVVLSGGAGANEHMAPLPLSDVVRLALGEIEDYTRVDVDVPDDIMVVPSLPADLILLLAELMENATAYSPPHTRVAVTANELRGGVRLAIVDQGLGMPPERLVEENARLTRRERLDLAPSEVLGLFVVGRLARRHSIDVHLSETPGGGITAWVDLTPQHLITRVESHTAAAVPPFPSVVPQTPVQGYHTSEFAQVIAGSAARSSVPGSQQPFDPNVLERATRTLENGQSWNAFAPVRASAPVIEAPVYDAEPVYSPGPAYQQPATYGRPTGLQEPYQAPYQEPYQAPRRPEPVYRNDTAQPAIDIGAPVAGRVPAALPELPAAGPGAWTPPPATPQATWTTPATEPSPAAPVQQPRIPRQRVDEDYRYAAPAAQPQQQPDRSLDQPSGANPLRRRVPGNQLPLEAGTKLPTAPPSQDDAVAARAAFDAFEAGVSRAQWDAVETDMSSPPAAGHAPLARRVPGATLPMDEPNSPPPPTMAPPLDPDAARALMEQFEYGVALALNETQPQPEGQPR